MNRNRARRSPLRIALNAVGLLLCVILLPVLIVNATLIVKSYIDPTSVPDFLGYKPFIVLSGSMETAIMTGDMVVVKETNPEQLKTGDIISYRSGDVVITHRIVEHTEQDGKPCFITKGDANESNDLNPVPYEAVEGSLTWCIPQIGSFALFMQTPTGLILFIALPIVLFLLIDMLSRRRENGRKNAVRKETTSDMDQLEEEVKRLYAQAGAKGRAPEETGPEQPDKRQ